MAKTYVETQAFFSLAPGYQKPYVIFPYWEVIYYAKIENS